MRRYKGYDMQIRDSGWSFVRVDIYPPDLGPVDRFFGVGRLHSFLSISYGMIIRVYQSESLTLQEAIERLYEPAYREYAQLLKEGKA